jgi:hypothetical protein
MNPEWQRPWGYLAQAQAQNRGLLLGAVREGEAFPQPDLSGWLGVHYWSDPSRKSAVQWGLSASPLFVPSMGSEVALSEDEDASAARFGRRPPGAVLVNGVLLPLRYRIDDSRLIEDVLFQPQLMAQLAWRGGAGWEGWASVSRAPVPGAQADVSGFVNVSGSGVAAVAVVKPEFPQRVSASVFHRIPVFRGFRAFNAIQFIQGGILGYELGLSGHGLSLSFLDERGASSEFDARYARMLMQAEADLRLSDSWSLLSGIKQHLQESGTWLRSRLEWKASAPLSLDVGAELFGGGDQSYFGEWRTNDRVFFGLNWRFG